MGLMQIALLKLSNGSDYIPVYIYPMLVTSTYNKKMKLLCKS